MIVREMIKTLPLVRLLRKLKYHRKFKNNRYANLFHGVYDSFQKASSHIPASFTQGYDNKASASMYKQWMNTIRLSDYPVLFWLDKVIGRCHCLYDLGGHIGFLYYSYAKLINFHPGFIWRVYDVPAVVDEGKLVAAQEKRDNIFFTSDHKSMSDADILLASGSLQYIEQDLADILNTSPSNQLQHIFVNMTPMHPDQEFFTVNSIGTSYCPYKISSRQKFLESMQKLNWKLVDEWVNSEKSCPIPFHNISKQITYYGFYFTKSM